MAAEYDPKADPLATGFEADAEAKPLDEAKAENGDPCVRVAETIADDFPKGVAGAGVEGAGAEEGDPKVGTDALAMDFGVETGREGAEKMDEVLAFGVAFGVEEEGDEASATVYSGDAAELNDEKGDAADEKAENDCDDENERISSRSKRKSEGGNLHS